MDKNRDNNELLVLLADSTDKFEGYSHTHAARIATLADEVAGLFKLARSDRQSLRAAALAHDLGEAAMNRDYIKRPGELNDEERLDMMRHPVIGEQEAARHGADRGAQLLVRWHHEWWNGTGYPDALRRDQIPFGARILRVVDSYVALTDIRPHRTALSVLEAKKYLTEGAGLEFDPRVVSAFLSLSTLQELDSYSKEEEPKAKDWEADSMIRQLVDELGN